MTSQGRHEPEWPPSCIRGALLTGMQVGSGAAFVPVEADNLTMGPGVLQCAAVAAQQAALAADLTRSARELKWPASHVGTPIQRLRSVRP